MQKTYRLELWAGIRIIVQLRSKLWFVDVQRLQDGKWLTVTDLGMEATRMDAMRVAVRYASVLLSKAEDAA